MSTVESFRRRLEPLLRMAFGLLFLLVGWLALTPQPATLSSGNDKSDHLLAFLALTLLLRHGWSRRLAWQGVLAVMLGYGAAIELLQLRVPGRDGSLLDLGADLIGILLALGISRGGWVSLR